DFNVKKIETKYKLNKLIDDIEEKEYYYNPLCKIILDKYAFSKDLRKKALIANNDSNSKGKIVNNLRKEIKEKFFDAEYILKSKINPHFAIREIDIIGKNDWVAGEVKRTWQSNYNKKTGLSELGRLLTEITRAVYFKNNNKEGKINAKRELIVEQVFKALNTIFGNMLTIKIINFPNNLITITAQYTTVGLYVSTIYSEEDPNDLEYVIYALIFFDNEFKPNVCSMRNDNTPFKDYIASGSIGDELYCFYSPNIYVGDYFFYTPENETIDNDYINKREDLKTIKELGLVSSWINSSYIPVSKDMDLYGKYLIEARQGNLITENVYAAITSEYATHKKAFIKLPIFTLVIFLSIIIICFIVQIAIKDLLLPINRLIKGAKSVETGNYKFRTEFYRSDELGALCDSFDKMMKGLEEKQLMNRMVSKTALKVTSKLSEIQSRKVDVVLLYISIPNFDKIMNNIQPDELFSKLRKQIALISKIIIDNGGDIDKIMGEKLLIAFHTNDNNSKEVAIKVSKIAKIIATNDNLMFNVSVGVNCGQVISGYLGVGEKRDFTIIGDPVNVTARIDSLAGKLESERCLISENIYSIIKDNVYAKLYGEVALKGKSEPMKVYRLS
ncbi:MAG: adenylate/guanylate cyclase domain-containing protein, partial [Candidatus Riflebacteria bacterium]|nr:adenylate/guanylate cyclase domain-containing protein [Candidatus Riflebacteria bacterium]